MFTDSSDSVWKMLFKQLIKIVIAILLIFPASYLSEKASSQAEKDIKHITELPVISGKDEMYKAQHTDKEYILEGIKLYGTPIHDTTGCFGGDYYYLDIYAEICNQNIGRDGLKGGYCWWNDDKLSKTIISEDLKVSCCDTKYFIDNVNTTRLYLDRKDFAKNKYANINYYYPSGNADDSDGNIRYSYNGLPVEDEYSAWISAENGKIKFRASDANKIFIPGNAKDYIKYLNDCSDDEEGIVCVIFFMISFALLLWIPISIFIWIKDKFF